MEKLGQLINDLQELYKNGASEDKLVAISLEILTELTSPYINQTNSEKVSVIMPDYYVSDISHESIKVHQIVEEEVTAEISEEIQLPVEVVEEPIEIVDSIPVVLAEKEIIAELSIPVIQEVGNIEHAIQSKETTLEQSVPPIHEVEKLEDTIHRIMEAPILSFETHLKNSGKEINSVESKQVFELKDILVDNEETFNDKLKEEHAEINHQLKLEPVKDIKKAFNINEKYVFINELFRGDDAMFERSLKTINAFQIYPEAEYWIQRELKVKLGWNENSSTVQHFDTLVKRRFAS